MLREVCQRLATPYPFPEGSDVDSRLAMTIGLAIGTIVEGLSAEAENRPMRINWTASEEKNDATKVGFS